MLPLQGSGGIGAMTRTTVYELREGDRFRPDNDNTWTTVFSIERHQCANHVHINDSQCWDSRQPVVRI